MDTPPSNGWMEAWHAAIAILGAGAIWAWNFVTGDIRKLRDTTVTKETFKEYTDRANQQRAEFREWLTALHEGQKRLDEKMNDQHVTILNAIHEVKK